MFIARDRAEYERIWNTDVSRAQVEAELGIRLPKDTPRLHAVLRLVLGGS